MLGKIQEPPGISKNFPLSRCWEKGNGIFILANRLKDNDEETREFLLTLRTNS